MSPEIKALIAAQQERNETFAATMAEREHIAEKASDDVHALDETLGFRLPMDLRASQLQERTAAHTKAFSTTGGEQLYTVGRGVIDLEPRIATARRLDEEPVGALAGWGLALDKGKLHSISDFVGVLQLEETLRARYDRDLAKAPPSVVENAYATAVAKTLGDATVSGEATLIRWTEESQALGWPARQTSSPDEVVAAQRLSRLVDKTRKARVPEEIRAAEQILAESRTLAQRARDIFKLSPKPTEPKVSADAS